LNIERYDQAENYAGRLVGTTLKHSDYAGMGPGRLAPIVCGWKRRTPLAEALRRALDNALAVLDVVTSRSAVSSDAKKGLGYVPDYQPLTAWDDAERRQRSLEVQ
jgi:acetolactate synthase-1/2/3 large subunit